MRFSGAGDRDFFENDTGAFQFLRSCFDVSVFGGDGGAELFKPFDVQVNGTCADGAAAGKRNPRLAGPREQWAEDEYRSAHRLYQFVRRFMRSNGG